MAAQNIPLTIGSTVWVESWFHTFDAHLNNRYSAVPRVVEGYTPDRVYFTCGGSAERAKVYLTKAECEANLPADHADE